MDRLILISTARGYTRDWSDDPLVEVDPFKLGGVPILKGTRMQADSVVENYVNGSPIEEIAYNFSIPEETIRLVLEFADAKQKTAVHA